VGTSVGSVEAEHLVSINSKFMSKKEAFRPSSSP